MSKLDIMIAELECRTRDEIDDPRASHADYAVLWLESGGTLLSLAHAISDARGIVVRRAALSRYLSSIEPDWAERSRRAREIGAIAMAEEAHSLAAKKYERDDVPGAKLRIDTKLKVATMFNRAEFGPVNDARITLNIGQLHLDAMRRRSLQPLASATTKLLISDAERPDEKIVLGGEAES